jgi:branched-subunit amino acid transport protein
VTTWIALLVVGAGSYAFRSLPLFVGRFATPTPRTRRLVGDAGLAAIVALVAGSLRHHADAWGPAHGVVAAAALAVTAGLSARGRPFPVALGAGLAVAVGLGVAVTHLVHP